MSPTFGLTRKLPPSSSVPPALLGEQDQARDVAEQVHLEASSGDRERTCRRRH